MTGVHARPCSPSHVPPSAGSSSITPRLVLLCPALPLVAQNECTPLHCASCAGRVDVVRVLLAAGANKEAANVVSTSCSPIAPFEGT